MKTTTRGTMKGTLLPNGSRIETVQKRKESHEAWAARHEREVQKFANANPSWTIETPNEIGVYWLREHDRDVAIAHVGRGSQGTLAVLRGNAAPLPVTSICGLWYGPIAQPAEPRLALLQLLWAAP